MKFQVTWALPPCLWTILLSELCQTICTPFSSHKNEMKNFSNGAKERTLIFFYMPQWISELSTNTPTFLLCLLNSCISTINEKKI